MVTEYKETPNSVDLLEIMMSCVLASGSLGIENVNLTCCYLENDNWEFNTNFTKFRDYVSLKHIIWNLVPKAFF